MEKRLMKDKLVFDEYTEIDGKCTKLIPREFAFNNSVLPFYLFQDNLYVAMENINNEELIERLRLLTRRVIIPCEGTETQIYLALKSFYENSEVEKNVKNLQKIFSLVEKESSKNSSDMADIENSPIFKLTDTVITRAISKGASDIHIEPQENKVIIRFRVDGQLFDVFELPNDIYNAIVTRIKVMGDMDISEKRVPQDGKARYKSGERSFDLRISSLPTLYGEKLVIRILYKSLKWNNLSNLGLNKLDYNLMKRGLRRTHGMILVTGPTGSGKSSTMYAMLGEISTREKNVTTIEDPVEISINGINQINVNKKAGITFASGLRSILRQDPDVILIGEIRDEETASIAVRAAITGHLVLSTLHTNDSISAINRLSEMGIPRYLLSDALITVIAQRLVRKICVKCKKSYVPTEAERKMFFLKQQVLYKGEGCADCNGSGYLGRQAICEVLYIDNNMKSFILNGEDLKLKDYQEGKSMKFLIHNCRDLVLQGVTTVEEFIRVSNGEIDIDEDGIRNKL
jgi:type IV pilus assembly protein PilB